MEADSWSRLSAASKRHQSTLQSRFDLYLGLEDVDGGEDDSRAEFACPFCAEDFDIVGLCCHIDEEHPVEAKNGVCPVCAERVGMDMVSHITTQHGNFFKMQRRRRFRRGSLGSRSTLSLLRKELREGNLQSLFGGSSYTIAPSNAAADPLLSSFITNLAVADPSREEEPESLDDKNVVNETSEVKAVESSRIMPLTFPSVREGVIELLSSINGPCFKAVNQSCLTRTRRREPGGASSCRGSCCPRYSMTYELLSSFYGRQQQQQQILQSSDERKRWLIHMPALLLSQSTGSSRLGESRVMG